MNPLLKQYLESKLGANYEEDQKKQLESAQSSSSLGNLFGDLGDIIGGKSIGSTDKFFQSKVDDLKNSQDQSRKSALADYSVEKELNSDVADQEAKARENDPKSKESMLASELVKKMGRPELAKGITAAQFKQFSPALKQIYDIESKKEENNLKRQEIGMRRSELQDLKIQEKQNQLMTPLGMAQTPDDAKQLKAASEEKANFDRKIDELIKLRQDNGGELIDREAVSRAKQLSKDLLLAYKNMAKLGVLSQSDESIINAIIPSDPLEFRSPLAAIQGQDPVLNNLKKFREDSNSDFEAKLKNRLREPQKALDQIASSQNQQQVPQTKVINGQTFRKVNGGWKKVNGVVSNE